MAAMGIDHVIALDGAYALYPNGTASSHPNQHAAITLACRSLGLGLTLSTPAHVWAGGECEKRTALFALGWAVAQAGDWFVIQDADMVACKWPADLKAQLQDTDNDAAEVEILDVEAQRANRLDWPARFEFRGFYRAQSITVGPRHCVYRDANGDSLWNGNDYDDPLPVLDLTGSVLFEHRPDRRSLERQLAKLGYYADRDAAGVELSACRKCGAPSTRLIATRWRKTSIGPVASWTDACPLHAPEYERVGRRQLHQLGIDPDSVVVENRMGRAPIGMTVRG